MEEHASDGQGLVLLSIDEDGDFSSLLFLIRPEVGGIGRNLAIGREREQDVIRGDEEMDSERVRGGSSCRWIISTRDFFFYSSLHENS